MNDSVWCTRSFFVEFSLIYEDLSNIHTTKIADYMDTEHCPSNHLMPVIALSIAKIHASFYVLIVPIFFSLNS